jgi:hypothetical protein
MGREVFYTTIPLSPPGGSLRSCEHCFFDQFNLGLDSLSHLCRCACVQDFADFESYEQQRHDSSYFSKHRIVVPSRMPVVMRNR